MNWIPASLLVPLHKDWRRRSRITWTVRSARFKRVLRENPTTPLCSIFTPEFETALRSARRAVALQPSLGAAQGVLAKLYLQSGKYQEAAEECRKALASNPHDQASLYHLIQALRKTNNTSDIPELLKRLALLRKQAAREQSQRYQYKLVEEDAPPN